MYNAENKKNNLNLFQLTKFEFNLAGCHLINTIIRLLRKKYSHHKNEIDSTETQRLMRWIYRKTGLISIFHNLKGKICKKAVGEVFVLLFCNLHPGA